MPTEKKCYAVKNKDESTRSASRSGGMFTALSDLVLNDGGVVYGCVLSDDFRKAQHIRAVTKNERNKMRGSKYIPSEIRDCYKLCGEDLKNGKKVLFSGTPCQIEALNCYLEVKKIDTSNLLRVDILCHTVASPLVWNKFLDWRSKDGHIDNVDFRDKKTFGWAHHEESITVDGKVHYSRIFAVIFGKNLSSPAYCSNCHFKSYDRPSDITLGDYWGITELDEAFDDNKGVSLVLANTQKGDEYFSKCVDCIEYRKFNLFDSIQPAFESSIRIPENQNRFYSDLQNKDFDTIIQKYVNKKKTFTIRLAEFLNKFLKR